MFLASRPLLGSLAPPLGAPWEPLGPPSVHLHVLGMHPIGIPQPFSSLAERMQLKCPLNDQLQSVRAQVFWFGIPHGCRA